MALTDINYSVQYKEVFLRTPPNDDWNEITLNTGGVPSTLQDVKAQQWSGGFVYKQIQNRFIYWRSIHNVFEMVEESLDLRLVGNQLRYKFTDSPVLNGISITELPHQIVVLVPTVSSLHRFTFPHPNNMNFSCTSAYSIFHGASVSDAMEPSSYYVLSSTSCSIAHAASCIAANEDAIFALALTNASVQLVRKDPEGSVSTSLLTHESIMPRFLAGFTDTLMRKEYNDNVSASMVFHTIQKHLYLFSLSCHGVLNVWCCHTGASLSSINLAKKSGVSLSASNKHMMMKGFSGQNFAIYCYLHGTCLTAVSPKFSNGSFEFEILSNSRTPQNLDMIHMAMGEYDDVWCCWLATGDEAALITRISWAEPDSWLTVALSRPPTTVKPAKFVSQDPASLFLDTIFTSGFFTVEDIRKSLNSYEAISTVKQKSDARSFICGMVESEIFSEIGEQSVDDHVFLRVAERCWSRIYSCCSQHIITGSLTLSLAWLGNGNLVLIQDSGFSLATRCDFMELFWLRGASSWTYPHVVYGRLLEIVRDIDLGAAPDRVLLGLHLGQPLQSHLDDAAKLVPPSALITEKCSLVSQEDLGRCFAELIKELSFPEDCILEGQDWKAFCGQSGLTAITQLFREFVTNRLNICVHLLVVMTLTGPDYHLTYKNALLDLCTSYYVLYWMCVTNVNIDTPVVQSFIVAQQSQVMQNTLEDSVMALVNALWPRENNDALVNHLFSIRQYLLIQDLSRIIQHHSWGMMLAESYLATGEYSKAYNVCMNEEGSPISHYLRVIRLFEVHSRPDFAITVAKKALDVCTNISPTDMETLQCILFLHQLELKKYSEAYEIIESCGSWQRKIDSLHKFLSTLISDGKLEELVSFSFTGLVDQLDSFLSTRARSLPFAQAVNSYNILYSYHIKHLNYKKAASVMFEKGMRSDNCEMQWRCFGACLNALSLVETEQAWILRPRPISSPNEDSIEVLDINEVRKEFELSGARYNLGNCPPDATKEEVVALCISQRQYRVAMRLTNMCGLPGSHVIESLAAACATLNDNEDWQWLRNNEIDDMIVTKDNARDMAWMVLRRFIEKYEKGKATELHRATAHKLLGLEMFLPAWLTASYCKMNATELLKLYLHHGYLEECSELAIDYLQAGMGIGKEAFSIDLPLLPNSPPLWIPVNTIDRVIKELEYYKLDGKLKKVFGDYLSMAMRVSNDKRTLVVARI
uniref:Nuclear pore complex protein Nup160 n=2 Tax=Lygus hesperus TaxID=30085 RepID=A0A0A9YT05_LYGHE